MKTEYLSHARKFTVAVDETDYRELLKPSAVLQYFQDLATAHANKLGVGYNDLLKQDKCWVISRLGYRVNKYPSLGEEISAITFPKKPRIVDVNRDYYVTDKDGNGLISGTSKWCVIGISDRNIKKCKDLFPYEDAFFNPAEPFENGNRKIKPLEELGVEIKRGGEFTVGITDLDRNRHMNNARYGDAVLNSCGIDELNEKKIASFDINFISELFVGDKFIVSRADAEEETYFEALKDGSETVVFRALIGWKKRA